MATDSAILDGPVLRLRPRGGPCSTTVVGRVIERITLAPISGADIYVGGESTTSLANGTFSVLVAECPPELEVTVEALLSSGEYASATLIVATVSNGNTNTGDIAIGESLCGNHLREGDEECDDGDNHSGDGCSAACVVEVCGNAVLEAPGEECDGERQCSGDCKLCGNGIVSTPAEECDAGVQNGVAGSGCSRFCTSYICGNGVLELGEQCDQGAANGSPQTSCKSDCTLEGSSSLFGSLVRSPAECPSEDYPVPNTETKSGTDACEPVHFESSGVFGAGGRGEVSMSALPDGDVALNASLQDASGGAGWHVRWSLRVAVIDGELDGSGDATLQDLELMVPMVAASPGTIAATTTLRAATGLAAHDRINVALLDVVVLDAGGKVFARLGMLTQAAPPLTTNRPVDARGLASSMVPAFSPCVSSTTTIDGLAACQPVASETTSFRLANDAVAVINVASGPDVEFSVRVQGVLRPDGTPAHYLPDSGFFIRLLMRTADTDPVNGEMTIIDFPVAIHLDTPRYGTVELNISLEDALIPILGFGTPFFGQSQIALLPPMLPLLAPDPAAFMRLGVTSPPATASCGNGIVETGEECETGPCCTAACDYAAAGTSCRASAGACDSAESCTGASESCPADAAAPALTVCRAAAGECDAAELCDGVGSACPADVQQPAGTSCTGDGVFCNGAEVCDGSGSCVHPGTPCLPPGPCMTCDETADACIDADADDDALCAPVDNCPLEFNPDQLNSDCSDSTFFVLGSCTPASSVPNNKKGCCDGGDVCDPCPANKTNSLCDPDLSGGQSIGAGGGSFSPDPCLSITVPPGALAEDTSISFSTGSDDPVNPASGLPFSPIKLAGSSSVHKIVMLPAGQTFALPVTMSFCWNDIDDDDIVEKGICASTSTCTQTPGAICDEDADCACQRCVGGGSLDEGALRLKRDGDIFDHAGFHPNPRDACGDTDQQTPASCSNATAVASCGDAPGIGLSSVANCCDMSANAWPFQTCYFSQYYVGKLAGSLIPGGGSPYTDCLAEWSVLNPFNEPSSDKRGLPVTKQTCRDGDVTCDGDGQSDGVCTFQIGVCFNVDDPRLVRPGTLDAACTAMAGGAMSWEITRPLLTDTRWPAGGAAAAELRDAVAALSAGAVIDPALTSRVGFPTALAGEDCAAVVDFPVPLGGPNADRRARQVVKIRTLAAPSPGKEHGVQDKDVLKLTCEPS